MRARARGISQLTLLQMLDIRVSSMDLERAAALAEGFEHTPDVHAFERGGSAHEPRTVNIVTVTQHK